MTKKHIVRWSMIALIVIIVALWLGIRYFGGSPSSAATPDKADKPQRGGGVIPVTVVVADTRQVLDGIRSVGNLVANEEAELSSEISGKVRKIHFSEGSEVAKGEVMVEINDDDLQAQFKRLQFQQQNLKEKLERQRQLYQQEAISREMFDQVQTDYNMLLADIEAVQVKIDRSQIKAPFSGVVGFRYVSEGSYIQPNAKIAKIVDYNTLKVEFSIPEKYVGMPLVGKRVYFTTESDKKEYSAVIYAMEPKVDENTRTVILRARYDNSAGRFRPGMSTRVTIPTTEAAEVLMIPTQAIVPTMDGKSVWVVREGAPKLVPVESGTRLEREIEILKGVTKGDTVIITGLMQLREGAKISINQ